MKTIPGEGERVLVDLSHPEHGAKTGTVLWRETEYAVVEFDGPTRPTGIVSNALLVPLERVTLA